MKMILFVLNDPAKVLDLLNAWKVAGASGATVFFSTGMGRIHQSAALRDDLPLMPSLSEFVDRDEKLSRTIFISFAMNWWGRLFLRLKRSLAILISREMVFWSFYRLIASTG
jgi:hypothetical protein